MFQKYRLRSITRNENPIPIYYGLLHKFHETPETPFQLDGSRLMRFANKPGSLPRGARCTQACLAIDRTCGIDNKGKTGGYQFPFLQKRLKPVVIKERRRHRNRDRFRFASYLRKRKRERENSRGSNSETPLKDMVGVGQ